MKYISLPLAMLRTLVFLIIYGMLTSPGIADDFKQKQQGIEDWSLSTYNFSGVKHSVYHSNHNSVEKPPIIILHQLPGLSKETFEYAETLTDKFSVYLPLLFGDVYMDSLLKGLYHVYMISEWSPKENRPIYQWMKQFSSTISIDHPNVEIGVIGMCLTGALPLALVEHPKINSIVVSQPTLPIISFSDENKASLDLSKQEYNIAKQRAATGQLSILGLRFQNDFIGSRMKLKTLKKSFPSAYIDLEICQSEYEAHNISESAHSVLINEWNSQLKYDHPVNIRRRQVKAFFSARLLNKEKLPQSTFCKDIID